MPNDFGAESLRLARAAMVIAGRGDLEAAKMMVSPLLSSPPDPKDPDAGAAQKIAQCVSTMRSGKS